MPGSFSPLGDRTNASASPRKRKADSANVMDGEPSPGEKGDESDGKAGGKVDEKGDESDGKAEGKAEEKVVDGVAGAAHGCTKCNMRKLAFFRASSKWRHKSRSAHLQIISPSGMSHLPLCSARPHGNR